MRSARSSARSYSPRTLKILWGRAAGRCAMPECRAELLVDDSAHDPVVIIGDIAHIEASSGAGPRGNRGTAARNRDEYENLILLCKNCHTRIDGHKVKYSVEAILKFKAEHEAWVRAALPERGLSPTAWTMVILQGLHPLDVEECILALRPDQVKGRPVILSIAPSQDNWPELDKRIECSVRALFDLGDQFNGRLAVFPLAPVSACVALGFYLTDRPRVRLFQYHRHAQSWRWTDRARSDSKFRISGLPTGISRKRGEVVVCVEISGDIQRADAVAVGNNIIGHIRLRAPTPSTSWLRSAAQLEAVGASTREVCDSILHHYPNAACWHLLVAAPAPIAVKIGQTMNPSMTPPVQLYEFNRNATQKYKPSIVLGDCRS